MTNRQRLAPAMLSAALMLGACAEKAEDRPSWNDINVIRENVEAPRAHFVPFESKEAALDNDAPANQWHQSLN